MTVTFHLTVLDLIILGLAYSVVNPFVDGFVRHMVAEWRAERQRRKGAKR
jgi:hypothetical protein